MYCKKCKRNFEKIPGKKLSKCKMCKQDVMYDCMNCTKRYITLTGLRLHLKLNKCPGMQDFYQMNSENEKDKSCNGKKKVFHVFFFQSYSCCKKFIKTY